MNKVLPIIVAAGALSFSAQQAQAVAIPLPPGATTPVGVAGSAPASPVLATRTDNFVVSAGVAGTLTSSVYASDPAINPLGGLIFTYSITLNSIGSNNEPLTRLSTDSDWAGFLVNSSQYAAAGTDEPALSASSSPSGAVLGFNFSTQLITSDFVGGESSTLLMFGTDAQNFRPSGVNLIDGGVAEVPSYAPAGTTVPDGGLTAILLALGSFGLVAVRRTM